MSSLLIASGVLIFFYLGYRFYARYLDEKVFYSATETETPPAIALRDNIDYSPTNKNILFGHHFSSIAGAAPIVGPAVAIIWGWVPAILWITLGVVFLGATHDFATLYLSMRHKGQSIATIAESVLGTKAKILLLFVIFFLIWMVIAVFALVIANLFISFPSAVLPVNFEIVIALLIGYFVNKKNKSITLASVLAQVGLIITIYLGTLYPISLESAFGSNQIQVWILFLLIYSFLASVMPVWLLLQPRDYINSHQLMLGLAALIIGLIITNPPIVAPTFNPTPLGAPSFFPFLFITIACGAISGFHGLVSSGTTSKQVKSYKDAKFIGYGSMIGEGVLALLATLAVSAGFKTTQDWHHHFSSWDKANGLAAKISAFVTGSSQFLNGIGISTEIAQTVIAVMIISFAATSLDTATRIQRYVIGELGEHFKIPYLKNRYLAGTIAVLSAYFLILSKEGGTGGLTIWPLFGATNQMLAALSLTIISSYLKIKGKNGIKLFSIPAKIIIIVTLIALIINLMKFWQAKDLFLCALSLILIFLQISIIGIKAKPSQ